MMLLYYTGAVDSSSLGSQEWSHGHSGPSGEEWSKCQYEGLGE